MTYTTATVHQDLIDLAKKEQDNNEMWLINSGATANVTANDEGTKYVTRSKRHVQVGNSATCHAAAGEGKVIFQETKTGLMIKMTPLIVPGLAKNILSVKCLMGMG
jgi:hypothetical protein